MNKKSRRNQLGTRRAGWEQERVTRAQLRGLSGRLLAVATLCGAAWSLPFQAQGRPNIVIFFSDDHTQQAISAYQDLPGTAVQNQVFRNWAPAETPNIDRIGDQGVIFRNSFVSNSICAPQRACLLTGLHSHANGVTTNYVNFNGSQQTLPKLLQSAGYDTALFGKWHFASEPTGFAHYERLINPGTYYSPVLRTTQAGGGTSDVSHSGQYISQVLTDRTVAWLQDRLDAAATGPFFLMVNHKGTHGNWEPGPVERDLETFRHVEWDYTVTPNPDTDPGNPASWTPLAPPRPANFDDYVNNYPTRADGARLHEIEIANGRLRLDHDFKLPGSSFGGAEYDEVRAWWSANQGSLSTSERDGYLYNRYVKDYMRTGQGVDRSVGDILDFLEANNLDRNTIIIYASDQGFFLGEHGWYDKRWMYEESLRTPLLLQWKDAAGTSLVGSGGVIEETVQVIDLAPTLLEAAGVTAFSPMHGESFLGYATSATGDEPASWRQAIYYHYYEALGGDLSITKHYGIRTNRHKLIYQYEVGQWELFDLDADPTEMNNLLYDAGTGQIDDPTDGIDGPVDFQDLVTGLMRDLRDLRSQYGDTTGPGFTIPSTEIGREEILNGGFDDGGSLDRWTVGGGSGSATWNAEASRGQISGPQAGTHFAIQNGDGGGSYIYQSFVTNPGTIYELSFHVARPQTNNSNFALEVDVFDGIGDPGGPGSDGSLLDERIGNGDVTSGGTWVPFAYQFEAVSAATTLRFLDPGTTSVDPALDTVVLSALVNGPPVAGFTASVTGGPAPLTVDFTDTSTGSPTSWLWNFGDGGTSTDQNPSHTYTTAGTYTVTLTATNANGSGDEIKTDYVTVNTVPAGPSLLTNGGFDATSGSLDGWTAMDGTVVGFPATWNAEASRGQISGPQEGSHFAIGFGDGAGAYIYQPIATTAGTTYELSFHAARPQTNNANFGLEVDVFDGVGDPGGPGSDGGLLDVSIVNGDVTSGGDWVKFTYQFTAASATTTLRFLDPGTTGVDPAIDSVTVIEIPGLALALTLDGGTLEFEWNSRAGMQYDLVNSDDLSSPVSTWPVYNDGTTTYGSLPASGNGTNTLVVPRPADAVRFFAVIEEDVP